MKTSRKKIGFNLHIRTYSYIRGYLSGDFFIFITIFIAVLLFKSNIINAPFHWDALSHVRYSLRILEENIYPNRPSLLFFCLAIIYRLFGFSILLTHLTVITFSALVLFFTYKLSSYLFDNITALGAVLFLFFSPLFFSQSGIINQSVLLTLMCLLCVYYFFKKR